MNLLTIIFISSETDVEATVQATSLPEKGVWHRVRVGPYTRVEELTRARDTLKQNGVETSLIKVREARSTL